MTVAAADLQKAILVAWNTSSLPATFTALGAGSVMLHDQEAPPGASYPYVVMEELAGASVTMRMSGGSTSQRIVRDVPVTLHVYAAIVDEDSRSAKQIAAHLAEEILKVFGGHPTIRPTAELSLDNGNHLITRYLNDYGIRTGDDEYEWKIDYEFRLDVPVMN